MRAKNAKTVLPAVAMTAVSMVLTLAVVTMWLGSAMPWLVALVVGLGIDGGGWPPSPMSGASPRRATTPAR